MEIKKKKNEKKNKQTDKQTNHGIMWITMRDTRLKAVNLTDLTDRFILFI